VALFGWVLVAGCGDDPVGTTDTGADVVIRAFSLTLNPSRYAPLTAEVALTTHRPVRAEIEVRGPEGDLDDVDRPSGELAEAHTLPILGLLPETTHTVRVRLYDEAGTLVADTSRMLTTDRLIVDLPEVRIDTADPSSMKPGMNLVSYFGHASQLTPQRPFIFDSRGRIRWYLDVQEHPSLASLFYDNGPELLANGNLYFGDGSTDRIIEMDMMGRMVRSWSMPGYEFHHNVIEKPNGNFVVTVNKEGAPTVEDFIIEIDRESGTVVREWDLNRSLDNTRRAWQTDLADLNVDWFHANGLAYDASDDGIVVSGRTQGTVKLTNDNRVVWILAPHRDWGTAGDGTDLESRLLQPLDAAGQPITNQDVLSGIASHQDFEWAWYQHAPELLPDGRLLIFDNGDNRHYAGQPTYSRAVVYDIDEAGMTVRQAWQFGKERGTGAYSRIVSDVDFHADVGTIVFMPGAVRTSQGAFGKIVEVEYDSRDVVFEATVTPPTAPFGITFHRVERVPLRP
jgi:arylsulfate sulfotransferase